MPYLSSLNDADIAKGMFYYGNAPPIPWSKIDRWKYMGYLDVADPPSIELYAFFSIEQHFFILLATIGCNIAIQLMAKACLNPKPDLTEKRLPNFLTSHPLGTITQLL